jgi:hypothetical protein
MIVDFAFFKKKIIESIYQYHQVFKGIYFDEEKNNLF